MKIVLYIPHYREKQSFSGPRKCKAFSRKCVACSRFFSEAEKAENERSEMNGFSSLRNFHFDCSRKAFGNPKSQNRSALKRGASNVQSDIMRKAHESAKCKCGRDLIDGTCEGCGLPPDMCDCEYLENLDDFAPKREIKDPMLR